MDPYETLMEISRTGNLPRFFEFYCHPDSFLLDHYIDRRLLIDTPLHEAASMGHSHFAAEVLRLKPSYASKLNYSGLSPIHVALRNGHDEVVERLVEHDRNTVRHDAGEGRTALHYVIAQQNINLLRSFELSCPDSIEDKTIRRETALHIALQHYNPMIFERLVGWLKRRNKEYILNKADIDGNTVLHMATSNNQTEAVELLLSKEFNRKMEINAKNKKNKTALDIAIDLESRVIEAKLRRAKALRGASISHDPLEGIPTMAQEEEEEKKLKDATLLAGMTFQAMMNPPVGIGGKDDAKEGMSFPEGANVAGTASTLKPGLFFVFYLVNSVIFYTSLHTIQLYDRNPSNISIHFFRSLYCVCVCRFAGPNLSLTSLPQNLSLVTQLLFFVLSFSDTVFNRLEHLDLKVVAYIIPFVPLLIDFMFTLVV